MPRYRTPGVYVDEVPGRIPAIAGVSTSTAGFVGQTERGPTRPTTVTGWGKYQSRFGGLIDPALSYLPYAVRGFFANGGQRLVVARIKRSGGAAVAAADFIGGDGVGLTGLAAIDSISLLCVPDEAHPDIDASVRATVRDAMLEQCARLRDRFAILSAAGESANPAVLAPPHDSQWGAFYAPWIRVRGARRGQTLPVPPSGHLAGIYARTDAGRGVHKAPVNEVVRNIARGTRQPLVPPIGPRVHEILNPRGVNVIRDFRAQHRGVRVWGARTMSSDPEWKYVNVRRHLIYLEQSIDRGTRWVVFEPNDERLWGRVKRSIEAFLTQIWRNGALQGSKPSDAFFVHCDRTTMTRTDIDNGQLVCLIGVAPVKPAEFVIFRIGQKTADARS